MLLISTHLISNYHNKHLSCKLTVNPMYDIRNYIFLNADDKSNMPSVVVACDAKLSQTKHNIILA